MKMTTTRDKMLRGQADAADQQPWRCVKCKKAVRPGMNDPCDCTTGLYGSDGRWALAERELEEAPERR